MSKESIIDYELKMIEYHSKSISKPEIYSTYRFSQW